MTEKFIAYKKNGEFDKEQGFIHESCFEKIPEEKELVIKNIVKNDKGEEVEEITLHRVSFLRDATDEEIIAQNYRLGYEAVIIDQEKVNEINSTLNARQLKSLLISARKRYLKDTDWYLTRELEIIGSLPQEVREKRQWAREEINEIESLTDIADLETFNINF